MNEYFSVILSLIKVVIAFVLLYVIFPSRVIKLGKSDEFTFLDKFFIYFINANLVTIILVHILVVFNIYESISLLISFILVSILFIKFKSKYKKSLQKDEGKVSLVASALDIIDENKSVENALVVKIKERIKHEATLFKARFGKIIRNPVASILFVAAISYGVYVRLSHAFVHAYYASYDPYVHLAWTKYLGNNDIYVDGVYPYGYNSIISAINKIFFIDPHTIIRFFGVIGGILLMVSIFYILHKQIKTSIIPAVLGVLIYAFATELPIDVWRQLSALPQEYALIFLLPGMHFLLMYFKSKKNSYLFLASEVLVLTLLIHMYVSIFLVLGYIIILIFNIKSLLKVKIFVKVFLYMFVSGIIGILPIGIGVLSGIPLHGPSIDFIVDSADPQGFDWSKVNIFGYMEKDMGLIAVLVALAVILFLAVIGVFYKKEKYRFMSVSALIFVVLTTFLYLQYRHEDMGIPAIMEYSRTGIFLGVLGTVVLAMSIGLLSILPINKILKAILKTFASAVILLMVINTTNIKLPVGIRLEYDEAANSYMDIKANYPALNWTLVAPVEQYPQVIGYGWHYELWRFTLDVTTTGTSDVLTSTEYVFIFIEKYPINSNQMVTREEAQKPFPLIGNSLDEYYTNEDNRRIIQAKAYYFMEDYIEIADNVSIYLETDKMIIYEVHNEFFN